MTKTDRRIIEISVRRNKAQDKVNDVQNERIKLLEQRIADLERHLFGNEH